MSSVPSQASGPIDHSPGDHGSGGFALDQDQIRHLIGVIADIRDQVQQRFVTDDNVEFTAPGHDTTSQQTTALIAAANRDRTNYGKLTISACDEQIALLRAALRDYGSAEEANTMRT